MNRTEESNDDELSGVGEVVLFARITEGVFNVRYPILVSAAERQECEEEDTVLFSGISYDVDRCVWNLWVSTFNSSLDGFRRRGVTIGNQWVIRDPRGVLWSIQRPVLVMMGTLWRCPALEIVGPVPVLSEWK